MHRFKDFMEGIAVGGGIGLIGVYLVKYLVDIPPGGPGNFWEGAIFGLIISLVVYVLLKRRAEKRK